MRRFAYRRMKCPTEKATGKPELVGETLDRQFGIQPRLDQVFDAPEPARRHPGSRGGLDDNIAQDSQHSLLEHLDISFALQFIHIISRQEMTPKLLRRLDCERV